MTNNWVRLRDDMVKANVLWGGQDLYHLVDLGTHPSIREKWPQD